MKYKATLGPTAIIITIVSTIILGGVIGLLIRRMLMSEEMAEIITALIVVIAIMALYVACYLYRPMFYLLDNEKIIIRRPIKDVTIQMKEITDAILIRKESMQWTERTGGNGGLFGFYGSYRNNFGAITMYATKLDHYLLIETRDKDRYILTPDDKGMVKEIRKLIGK